MITLFIVIVILALVAALTDWNLLPATALALTCFLTVLHLCLSDVAPPAEYTRVDRISYMTEDRVLETLAEEDYYTDGANFYSKNFDRARWVPFATCEYVKMELPGEVVAWGSGDIVDSGQADTSHRFCTSCGNELGEGDKFCAGCGDAVEVKE